MAGAAADAGAEFRLKAPVLRVDGDRVVTGGPNGGEVGFRILVAADGPKGTVARSLGMARAPTHLAGVQADLVVDEPVETRYVEIHPNAAPEFFAWRIPVSDRVVRVGLCGETGVPALFRAYLARWPGQVVHHVTGTIPLGTMPRTYGQRTLFVGDAAGLAKPTSGGGVYTGVRSGRYAAETAAACLEAGDISDGALAAYEARWKADFGREIALGYRLQLARRRVAPDEIDRLLRAFGNPKVVRAIVEYGDMDRPSGLLARLVRMPALWPVLPIIMRLGIAEMLAQDGR
jgi:flavin-dependent dehydrogenase